MCPAHTCIRSALTQAFHAPNPRFTAASSSVPDFLVPALARPSRSLFATSRAHKQTEAPIQPSSQAPKNRTRPSKVHLYLSRPLDKLPLLRIPRPEPDARRNIQAWLTAIDPFLPLHLRRFKSESADTGRSVPSRLDFSWFIGDSQDASQDILGYMGLVEERWDTVMWIVKKIVEDGAVTARPPLQLEPFANLTWPESTFRTLNDLTSTPFLTQRIRPSRKLGHTLDELTSSPESIELEHTLVRKAFGQIWRSLGNMILAASESDNPESSSLSHTLEIIAYLHHAGLVPDSVYTQRQIQDNQALQQPPTLHLLSTEILTALSDATWRAHEASVKVAQERMNASYFLGHEIPGSRYKIHVKGVAPELWLELVLWSCLHGGYISDGTSILEQILQQSPESGWRLISWRELVEAEEKRSSSNSSKGWHLFNRGRKEEEAASKAEFRARIQRTISSEVVTAFIDGLVNTMRVGVGVRGTGPEDIVHHIGNLKKLLDSSFLSLGSASWDSIMVRLLESGGVIPEKRPELLLRIVGLAAEFGTEVASANASPKIEEASPDPSYFFEPSTASLGLLHRTIRSHVENGGITGALTTISALQQYTDINRQKSIQQFFATLKGIPTREAQPFTSRLPPVDFPAFDPQLPVPLLAKLLDMATDAKLFDLGRSLLFSEEIDGPLINRTMYNDPIMAASIIRFGTLAGENDLVLKIVKTAGINTKDKTTRLSDELLTAMLRSQVQLYRWESVQGMQNYVLNNSGYRVRPSVLATFAAELLRLSNEDTHKQTDAPLEAARQAFTGLVLAWENLLLTQIRNELYSVLGILSSVSEDWKGFCSQFLAFSGRQKVKLSTEQFNQVLMGALDGLGSSQGKKMVKKWCYRSPRVFEPHRAPGGLPDVPRVRVDKSADLDSRPHDIEIIQPSGANLILQGRVHANRQTIWAVLRTVQQEEEQRKEKGLTLTPEERLEVRKTLRWAAGFLFNLGSDYEDIIRDLGSLAELAEFGTPPSRTQGSLATGH